MARTQVPPSMRSEAERLATVVVGAQDSARRKSADVRLDGTADQVEIMDIMDFYRGKPHKILFQDGLYSLTDEILVNSSWVTFEGESIGKWRRYNGGGGFNVFPRSSPGTVGEACGALFVQNGVDKDCFVVGNIYPSGEERHKDIVWSKLSMWGPTGTGCAIKDLLSYTDVPLVQNCFIHGFEKAIDAAWDNGLIFDNNIQDTGGSPTGHAAVRMRGYRGIVSRNTIYQVSGNGIWAGAEGLIVSNNIVGATLEHNVLATSGTVKISDNTLVYPGGDGPQDKCNIVVSNYLGGNLMSGLHADGVIITGNSIQRTHTEYENFPTAGAGTGSGDGVRIGEGRDGGGSRDNCNSVIVSANYISTGPATSGAGVRVAKGSAKCIVTPNAFVGPWAQNVNTTTAGSGGVYAPNT